MRRLLYPVLLVRTYWSIGKLNNWFLRILLNHKRFIYKRLMCLRPLAVSRVLSLSGSFWIFTWLHHRRKHQNRNCLSLSSSSRAFPQLITAVPHRTDFKENSNWLCNIRDSCHCIFLVVQSIKKIRSSQLIIISLWIHMLNKIQHMQEGSQIIVVGWSDL
jgi:hypothetical protein